MLGREQAGNGRLASPAAATNPADVAQSSPQIFRRRAVVAYLARRIGHASTGPHSLYSTAGQPETTAWLCRQQAICSTLLLGADSAARPTFEGGQQLARLQHRAVQHLAQRPALALML